uniref:Chloride channel protein 3 (ClC-3) n=1 Tax=mine drainage metagenome TaxID=410659 RepID=E6QQI5_9ZZZZ
MLIASSATGASLGSDRGKLHVLCNCGTFFFILAGLLW